MKIASVSIESQEAAISPEIMAVTPRNGVAVVADATAQNRQPPNGQPDPKKKEEDISLQKVQNVTDAVDSYMASLGVNLKFNVDERTDTVQVEVHDQKTNKLIRKIPADEMLNLAASIEKMVGLFLNKTL